MASHCQPNDFLCKTGDLLLPKPVRRILETYIVGDDNTLLYVTYWSLVHVLSGFLLVYLFNLSYLNGFLIHTIAEIYQILVRNTPFHTLRGRVDIVTDTVLFMGGMVFSKVIYR